MAGSRKPDPKQYQLPWEAAKHEQRELIKRFTFERLQQHYSDITKAEWRNMQFVLEYFVFIAGPQGIIPKQKTVAQKMGKTDRTVRSTLARMEEIGILFSRRRGHTNEYTIDWPRVATLVADRPPDRSEKTSDQSGNNFQSERKNFPIRAEEISDQSGNNFRSHNMELSSTYQSTYSSSTSSRTDGRSEVVEEDEVSIFKKNIRSKLPAPMRLDEAVDAALAAGCTLEELRDRMRWFLANLTEWSVEHRPGVLYECLRRVRPGMKPEQGWPHFVAGARR